MANQADHATWQNPLVLRGAGVFVVLYAFAAAWVVISGVENPDPLRLERTADGTGVVISGDVTDADSRVAIIDAVGEVTGAAVIVSDIDIDPDADPIPTPRDEAARLAASLPPDRN